MVNPLGTLGENIASKYLQGKGHQVIDRNFRTRLGEIDIISRYQDTLIFIEVKARIDDRRGKPYEAVTPQKLAHLKKALYYYLMIKKITKEKMRIDVVSIIFNNDRSVRELRHFENVGV